MICIACKAEAYGSYQLAINLLLHRYATDTLGDLVDLAKVSRIDKVYQVSLDRLTELRNPAEICSFCTLSRSYRIVGERPLNERLLSFFSYVWYRLS
jgi:hypothetical protein